MTTLLTDLNVTGNLNVGGSGVLTTRGSDQTWTGSLTAAAQTVASTVNGGQYTIAVTGTFVASFLVEYWDGSGWGNAVSETGYWFGGSAVTTVCQDSFVLPMRTLIRIRCSAYTSGTANVTITAHETPSAMMVTTTNSGALYVRSTNNTAISTANSSVANLAGAAVFTGTSEDVSDYAEVRVMVYSSHGSATNGLSLQQSTDGTNWFQTDVWTVSPTTSIVVGIGVAARYFRLVYTNGATLTTTLQIQTIFHKVRTKPSSNRPSDARTNELDAEDITSMNMLFNGTTWDRARGTNGVMDVKPSSATSVAHGVTTVTTAGTRVQVATNTIRSITFKAPTTNTGIIYVGGSTVAAANGFPLSAGDTISMDITNSNLLYVDASANAQTVAWLATA